MIVGEGFWYLATPYTKWENGPEDAAIMAGLCAAELVQAGLRIYSPIAHSHALMENLPEPLRFSHSFWMDFDRAFVEAAVGCIVAKVTGWDESSGVRHEIDEFHKAQKPVFYWTPATYIAKR